MTVLPPYGTASSRPVVVFRHKSPPLRSLCVSQLQRHSLWLDRFRMEHRRQIEMLRDAARQRVVRLREHESEWERRRRVVLRSSWETLAGSTNKRGGRSLNDDSRTSTSVSSSHPPSSTTSMTKHEWDRCLSPRLRKICSKITPPPTRESRSKPYREGMLITKAPYVKSSNDSKVAIKELPKLQRSHEPTRQDKPNRRSSDGAGGGVVGGGNLSGGVGRGGAAAAEDTQGRRGSLASLKFPPDDWQPTAVRSDPVPLKGWTVYSKRGRVLRTCATCPVCAAARRVLKEAGQRDKEHVHLMKSGAQTDVATDGSIAVARAKTASGTTTTARISDVSSANFEDSEEYDGDDVGGSGSGRCDDDDISYNGRKDSNTSRNKKSGKGENYSRNNRKRHSQGSGVENVSCSTSRTPAAGDGSLNLRRCASEDTRSDGDEDDDDTETSNSCYSGQADTRNDRPRHDSALSERIDSATLYDLAKWYERFPSTPVKYWQRHRRIPDNPVLSQAFSKEITKDVSENS